MISLITVAYKPEPFDELIELFIKSILEKSKLISEIIIVHGKSPNEFIFERKIKNIKIINVAPKPQIIHHSQIRYKTNTTSLYKEHSMAMHYGLSLVTQPYVLMSDPDIIIYLNNFDELYLNLYEEYNLNIIGVSHYCPTDQPFYLIFPTIINCLIKKEKLPNVDWLKSYLKLRPIKKGCLSFDNWPTLDGCYLLGGCIPQKSNQYLNTNCYFNPGCNLWLWDKELGKKFITFVCLPNKQEYKINSVFLSKNVKNIFDYTKIEKNKTLLKHTVGWGKKYIDKYNLMKEWYKKSINKKFFI